MISFSPVLGEGTTEGRFFIKIICALEMARLTFLKNSPRYIEHLRHAAQLLAIFVATMDVAERGIEAVSLISRMPASTDPFATFDFFCGLINSERSFKLLMANSLGLAAFKMVSSLCCVPTLPLSPTMRSIITRGLNILLLDAGAVADAETARLRRIVSESDLDFAAVVAMSDLDSRQNPDWSVNLMRQAAQSASTRRGPNPLVRMLVGTPSTVREVLQMPERFQNIANRLLKEGQVAGATMLLEEIGGSRLYCSLSAAHLYCCSGRTAEAYQLLLPIIQQPQEFDAIPEAARLKILLILAAAYRHSEDIDAETQLLQLILALQTSPEQAQTIAEACDRLCLLLCSKGTPESAIALDGHYLPALWSIRTPLECLQASRQTLPIGSPAKLVWDCTYSFLALISGAQEVTVQDCREARLRLEESVPLLLSRPHSGAGVLSLQTSTRYLDLLITAFQFLDTAVAKDILGGEKKRRAISADASAADADQVSEIFNCAFELTTVGERNTQDGFARARHNWCTLISRLCSKIFLPPHLTLTTDTAIDVEFIRYVAIKRGETQETYSYASSTFPLAENLFQASCLGITSPSRQQS